MSKKDDNPRFVTHAVCATKHTAVLTQIGRLEKDITDIKVALIGEPFKGGGIVGDLKELKDRKASSLSGKDLAAIVITFLTAIAAIIVALVK